MSLRQSILRLPLVRDLRRRSHLARFFSPKGFSRYYGRFGSFAEARAFLPATSEFDEPSLAEEYVAIRMGRIFAYDYPVILWLDRAFREGARSIFDLGGSVGVHHYAYRPYLDYPDGLAWEVCEVPAIARIGREIAATEGAGALRFVESLDPASIDADVLIASGAIHYVEGVRPGSLLREARHRPEHVFLNKLPVHEGEDFVTAQNIGKGNFAPQWVYGRERLVREVEAEGYRLVDRWDVHERQFYLPGRPDLSFGAFTGMYFRRAKTR